nr:hypothetical protein [Tanacetum cinerariifolium]
MDESMENPCFDEEEELNEFMDDDQDEEVEEWLMALLTPPRATVIDDLCVRMGNLEYRHGELVKKMKIVSDAEAADSIAIREIHPRVTTLEGQGTLISYVSWMEERLVVLEKRLTRPPTGP